MSAFLFSYSYIFSIIYKENVLKAGKIQKSARYNFSKTDMFKTLNNNKKELKLFISMIKFFKMKL